MPGRGQMCGHGISCFAMRGRVMSVLLIRRSGSWNLSVVAWSTRGVSLVLGGRHLGSVAACLVCFVSTQSAR